MHSQSPVVSQSIEEPRTLIHYSNMLWGLMWVWLTVIGLSHVPIGTIHGNWYVCTLVCAVLMVAGGIQGLVRGASILPRAALAAFALSLVLDWIYALPEVTNMSLLGCWTMILWIVNCDFRRSTVAA